MYKYNSIATAKDLQTSRECEASYLPNVGIVLKVKKHFAMVSKSTCIRHYIPKPLIMAMHMWVLWELQYLICT